MALSQRLNQIDGLRGFAVLLVILYHFKVRNFSNGFLGVDIFFVISGFVISNLIFRMLEERSFSISLFFYSRAKRLLPSLQLVIGLNLVVGYLVLLPPDYKELAQSSIASTTFLSNVFFYFKIDYFNNESMLKPLLHTWSLAVEEHFYILFPFIFYFLKRFALGRIAFITFVICVFLLVFSLYGYIIEDGSSKGFYWSIYRFWQLLVGVLAFLLIYFTFGSTIYDCIRTSNFLALISLTLIVFSLSNNLGIYGNILITFSMGLLLISIESRIIRWIFCTPFFIHLGLMSYTLYLVHNPIKSFIIYASSSDLNGIFIAGGIVLTYTISFLIYRYFESVLRYRSVNPLTFLILISSSSLALISFGSFLHYKDGLPHRFSSDIVEISNTRNVSVKLINSSCSSLHIPSLPSACVLGDTSNISAAIVGDSHAAMFWPVIDKLAKHIGIGVLSFGRLDCPFVTGFHRMDLGLESRCDQDSSSIMDYLSLNPQINKIIYASRWPIYINRSRFNNGLGGIEPGGEVNLIPVGQKKFIKSDDSIIQGIDQTITILLAMPNRKLMLIYPVPEMGWNIPYSAARLMRSGYSSDEITNKLSLTSDLYFERNHRIISLFDRYKSIDRVQLLRPTTVLCHFFIEGRCASFYEGKALYSDDDHLSLHGINYFKDDFKVFLLNDSIPNK